jgi:stage II sporulation protein D
MYMRPLTLLTVLSAALVLAAAAGGMLQPPLGGGASSAGSASDGTSNPTFVLTGVGNGHGVGLSQYGALAQARAGRSAADILSFYFPGTQLAHKPSGKLRVLLVSTAKSLAISSTVPCTVMDGGGQTHVLAAGTTMVGPDLQLPIDGVPTVLEGPLTFLPSAGGLVSVGNRSYRGTIEVTSTGPALQAIDVVGLEAYVQGVVPGEMPTAWPAAALQAQAIAARSYALATLVKGRAWDLYPDGRSQQYLGAGAETPETTAAVKATSGSVLLYGGTAATTFYSSSSGGRTQSGFDAFGLDVPYLPAQDDPWDVRSPYHRWQPRSYTGQELAKALGLSAPATDVQARFSQSGRVIALSVTAADGSSLAVAGTEARKRLALRSTAFHLATLRFLTPATATSSGVALRLTGIARDADHPALERLASGGAWTTVVRRLQVNVAGTFAAVVRPTQTTTYRLSASGLAGPVLTIPVVGAQP